MDQIKRTPRARSNHERLYPYGFCINVPYMTYLKIVLSLQRSECLPTVRCDRGSHKMAEFSFARRVLYGVFV